MKYWTAKDWVAAGLVLCLLIPFASLGISDVIATWSDGVAESRHDIEIAKVIGDLMKVIAGGLIGWIAGRNGNGNKPKE